MRCEGGEHVRTVAPRDVALMTSRIDEIDLSASLSREESEGRVLKAQRRLTQLRLFTAGLIDPHGMGPGLLVLFEGFDAAGKGGADSGGGTAGTDFERAATV